MQSLTASPARPVYQPVIRDIYYVPSSENAKHPETTPHFYMVLETARGLLCECLAGQNGRSCWHARAVDAGMVRPARLKPSTPRATPNVWQRNRPAPVYGTTDSLYS